MPLMLTNEEVADRRGRNARKRTVERLHYGYLLARSSEHGRCLEPNVATADHHNLVRA